MRRTGPAAIGALGLLAALAIAPAASAQRPGGGGGVKLNRVGHFNLPVYVTAARGVPGIFVVEQRGRVRVFRRGRKLRRPFLDIRSLVRFGGEQGLLSIAFHPRYRRNRLVYAFYVNNAGNLVIAEFRSRPRNRYRAMRASRRQVLEIPHPGFTNHNGGQLQFGPGGLYISTGDGGGAGDPGNNAQNHNSLLGKILRILPRGGRPYAVPRANPFAGTAGRGEIFSLGLRNPWRFSFDRVTARRQTRIAIGDVGQSRFEEINYTRVAGARGANFGWNAFEGFAPFPGGSPAPARHKRPIKVYPLTRGRCAVTGGYVVRDRRRARRLFKRYVYGDFCTGAVRSFIPKLRRARRDRPAGVRVRMLSSFGEGHRGAIYAASLNGPVFRLVTPRRGRRR